MILQCFNLLYATPWRVCWSLMVGTTTKWNCTYRNLEIACNKFSSLNCVGSGADYSAPSRVFFSEETSGLWFDSRKRPPPVIDHYVFAFWVGAYGRLDCSLLFQFFRGVGWNLLWFVGCAHWPRIDLHTTVWAVKMFRRGETTGPYELLL